MGTYRLTAVPSIATCSLTDVSPTTFIFEATFSRDPDTQQAWVTLSAYSRDAGWNGQTLESVAQATRSFSGVCTSCPMAVEETIRVDLLSQSQSRASQDHCPDGPAPQVDPDAGIFAPGPDAIGYDAVRACGVLSTQTVVTGSLPDGGACPDACSHCTVEYRLTGDRRK